MSESTIYIKCPSIQGERVQEVLSTIDEWTRSKALSALVQQFGSSIPYGLLLNDLVDWLLRFSARWDYRKLQQDARAKDIGEGARWLLNDNEITSQQRRTIEESAQVLGLTGVSEPLEKNFDYVLALGGARLSCLLRPRWAFDLVTKQNTSPLAVVLLTSSRPVSDSERIATDTYAKSAKTEFDLINAGAENCFTGKNTFSEEKFDDPNNVNRSWVIRKYESALNSVPVIALSAPSSDPDRRRANSADTYEFLFSTFNIPKGSLLLLVTSQIYVPYQQLEAIRTIAIPHDIYIETVGFPHDWAGELQGMTGPTNYLQEVRSTIQSAHRFVQFGNNC